MLQLQRPPAAPRRLALVRLPCPACGAAVGTCACTAAAEPLRLLRAGAPGWGSPPRRRRLHEAFEPVQGGPPLRPLQPPSPLRLLPGGAGASFAVGWPHTAHLAGSAPGPAAPVAAPVPWPLASLTQWPAMPAAPSAAPSPRRPAAAAAAVPSPVQQQGGGAWQAYLASRAAATAAIEEPPSGGPLAQLQAMSRRVRELQSGIAAFLLQGQQQLDAAGDGAAAVESVATQARREPAQGPAVAVRRAASAPEEAGTPQAGAALERLKQLRVGRALRLGTRRRGFP